MRLATIATALFILLLSTSGNSAESIGYIIGANGLVVYSTDGQMTDQAISSIESARNFCERQRYNAGIARISYHAQFVVQECMHARLVSDSPQAEPEWHETVDMAAELCSKYVSGSAFGTHASRAYASLENFSSCFRSELGVR